MENSRIAVIALAVLLSACANKEVKTEYVEKPVPYIVVPTPPTLVRPSLATADLTEEEKKVDGEVAKAYVITVEQLLNYSTILEKIIAKYDQMSKMSAEDRKKLNDRVESIVKTSNNSKTYFEVLDEELSKQK